MRVAHENPDPRCTLPAKHKACASWVRHVKGNPDYRDMGEYCYYCEYWQDYVEVERSKLDNLIWEDINE